MLFRDFDACLFDLDGVCYLGPQEVPYAGQSITRLAREGITPLFVTNNASRTPETVAQHLNSLGIPARGEYVVTAARGGAQLLAEHVNPGSTVLVVGTDALRTEVEKVGMQIVASSDDSPAAVIQGFTPTLTWEDMSEIALAIRKGALYVCTNMDSTIPRERGLMVGNGSIAAAITNSTGVVPLASGKPEPEIFHMAASLVNSHTPLAIGDNLSTDIAGAVRAQIPSMHVLTGLASPRDVALAIPSQRATYVCADLRALFEDYPSIELIEGESPHVRVGLWKASLHEGNIELESENERVALSPSSVLALDAYRALVHLCWYLADTQEHIWEKLRENIPHFSVQAEEKVYGF